MSCLLNRLRGRVFGWFDVREPRGPHLNILTLEDRVTPALYTVTSALDTGSGSGFSGDLRYCVAQSNGNPGADSIVFTASINGNPIMLGSYILITDSLTITGNGGTNTILDGNSATRHLVVDNAGAPLDVKLDKLTLTRGSTTKTGGAIYAGKGSTLTIENSTLSGNAQTGAYGGGAIYMRAAEGGSLTIRNSTISGNSAAATGTSYGGGGGLYVYGATTNPFPITISNSTFANNTTAAQGGAIRVANDADLQIINSTFVNNSAVINGGGIASYDGDITLESTLVAGNTITPGNIANDFESKGSFNADYSAWSANPTVTVIGDNNIVAASASLGLGTLADHGGPTPTVNLLPGSPLIDMGRNLYGFPNDQRGIGFPREQGNPDIGAFEFDPSLPLATVGSLVGVTADSPANNPYTFTVTYSVSNSLLISFATVDGNNAAIAVTGPNGFSKLAAFVSADTTEDAESITATYTFNPHTTPGNPWVNEDNGTYFISVIDGQIQDTNGNSIAAAVLGQFSVTLPFTRHVTNSNNSGPGSFRQAVLDTNANPGPDFIVFDLSTNTLPIVLTSLVTISDSVTITGNGTNATILDGNNATRLLSIDGPGIINVAINNFTITKGFTTDIGGAIYIRNENVTLTNTLLTANTTAGSGGAIYAGSGTALTLESSTLSGNSQTGPYGGGAIYLRGGTNGSLTIRNSTLSGNSASATNTAVGSGGGAIYLYSSTGLSAPVTISNSTIANNSTGGRGAIRINDGSPLTLYNTTIFNNKAQLGSGGISSKSGSVTLDSTVVAGNSVIATGKGSDFELAGTLNANFSAWSVAPGSVSGGDNVQGTVSALGLSNLANNGGPTQTVALNAGLLINAGRNTLNLDNDQRGSSFPRSLGSAPDIGALESNPAQPMAGAGTLADVLANTAGVNNPYTFQITYTVQSPAVINAASVNGNSNAIRINGPNGFDKLATFVSASPNTNANSITATYQFNPHATAGAPWVAADSGVYSVAIVGGQILATNASAVAAGTLGSFTVAVPATATVTTTADSGPGSLRQAILTANSAPNSPTIIGFAPSFSSGVNTITLASELPVSANVTINGTGADHLTISGNNITRIFNVSGDGILSFNLNNLTLAAAAAPGNGGAILNADEFITLDAVYATGNSSAGSGGVIYSSSGSAQTIIRNSTLSGNSAATAGGAVYLTNKATVTVVNSTLSGNSAAGSGGAIAGYSTSAGTLITLRNSTIVGNSAGGSGGGLRVSIGAGSQILLDSTIVAGNTAGTNGADVVNASVVATNSVISDASGWSPISYTGGLTQGTPYSSLLLGTLGNNGGPIPTVHIGSYASPLIDAGANTQTLNSDERGFTRVVGTNADIGAYEFNPATAMAVIASTLVNVGSNQAGINNPYMFSVTYSIAPSATINYSSVLANSNAIIVTGPNGFSKPATFVSTTANSDASSITATYQLNPHAVEGDPWLFADNGTYTITTVAGQVQASNSTTVPASNLGTFRVVVPGTYSVTNTNDSGPGSLRAALLAANSVPGAETINFVAGANTFTGIAAESTIHLTSPLPVISDALTINGLAGTGRVVISGDGKSRVLATFNAPLGTVITLNDLTLTAGRVIGEIGAGLLIQDENVTLNRVTLSNSTASNLEVGFSTTPAPGGGIAVNSNNGILTLNNSVVSGNSSESNGGGIWLASGNPTLRISESTIVGNTATDYGGGIFFGGGSLLLDRSTLSGNVAHLDGGGLLFTGLISTAGDGVGFKIRNSTISGNAADGFGGGLAFHGSSSAANTFAILNSTITGNTAATGGGLSNSTPSAFNIASTIITNNTATAPDVNFTNGTAVVNTSAIGIVPAFAGFDYSSSTNLNSTDSTFTALGLDPVLAFNGGPTRTHALASSGKAVDAGSNPDAEAFDQKGSGSPRLQGTAIDIGAVEASIPSVTSISVNGGSGQRSRITSITVNFSGTVNAADFQSLGAIQLYQSEAPTPPNGVTIIQTGATGAAGKITVTQATTTSLTLTFSNANGASNIPGVVQFASLADGRYRLNIPAAGASGYLSNPSITSIRRLFGDINGDGTVNGIDFAQFGLVFGGSYSNNPFDYDNSGNIDGTNDFAAFGARFGSTV